MEPHRDASERVAIFNIERTAILASEEMCLAMTYLRGQVPGQRNDVRSHRPRGYSFAVPA